MTAQTMEAADVEADVGGNGARDAGFLAWLTEWSDHEYSCANGPPSGFVLTRKWGGIRPRSVDVCGLCWAIFCCGWMPTFALLIDLLFFIAGLALSTVFAVLAAPVALVRFVQGRDYRYGQVISCSFVVLVLAVLAVLGQMSWWQREMLVH